MTRKSLSQIKLEQTVLTSAAVTETLSRERIALAELLAQESRLTFKQFHTLVESICAEILPRYQALERPEIFRSQIRDRLINEFIGYEEDLDHQDTMRELRSSLCSPRFP